MLQVVERIGLEQQVQLRVVRIRLRQQVQQWRQLLKQRWRQQGRLRQMVQQQLTGVLARRTYGQVQVQQQQQQQQQVQQKQQQQRQQQHWLGMKLVITMGRLGRDGRLRPG